ncbi:TetR/AcrR family transcriptional regulator [Silvimonas amylolytica]|uniref:TetR family transcriptional regulator n=1 Tax=Silvimonas amylolytica TaxID=449663 RepID=A0ABQ2PMM0_9NEIS|nr:TetR/AcrR family transcriptional regulator [Silvimonas amylolytica]GGP26862.1 TetR family transcriptional regulator [Silvimonas amylolytica]
MAKKTQSTEKREDSLSRERIIEAAIGLLDRSGESGLTFRALAETLATGAGAIYWHVANKGDLLTAACDTLIARTLAEAEHSATTPQTRIRAIALALFETMDAHPWTGSALTQAPGQLPGVRMLEHIGQQVRALGVPDDTQWVVACTLLNYIVGVGGQNAVNAQYARSQDIERDSFLEDMSEAWSALDADEFAFTRSMTGYLCKHDDREDFLAGIDLILSGLEVVQKTSPPRQA